MPSCSKKKSVLINGVPFRLGELDWEDAMCKMRAPLPDFASLRRGREYVGMKKSTSGLIAQIGRYFVVISERDEKCEEFDFTLVPLSPQTEVRYA